MSRHCDSIVRLERNVYFPASWENFTSSRADFLTPLVCYGFHYIFLYSKSQNFLARCFPFCLFFLACLSISLVNTNYAYHLTKRRFPKFSCLFSLHSKTRNLAEISASAGASVCLQMFAQSIKATRCLTEKHTAPYLNALKFASDMYM